MTAIETRYAGCRFRSRLEARWAVFFDAIGVEWQYEPEGFDLPSGRYLPDFLVTAPTGDRAWFEVKGPEPTASELALLHELKEATGDVAWFLRDVPRRSTDGCLLLVGHYRDYETPVRLGWAHDVDSALTKARSARFEHGERP